MSATFARNIGLTPVLKEYTHAKLASGHYSGASGVVGAGLRQLMERDQAVARLTVTEPKACATR